MLIVPISEMRRTVPQKTRCGRERALFPLGPQPWHHHRARCFPWASNPGISREEDEKLERQEFTQRVRHRAGLEPKSPP